MIDFHAITAEDQKLFRQYVFRSGIQNCDMSFANIFCWQDTYHSELAEHDGFLLTRFLYGENETGYMQPVGSGETRHIVEALREDAAHRGSALRIVGMTPGWRQRIEDSFPGQFAFSAPRSLRDYIYLASDLANLPGRRYQPKRNHINRFLSKYEYRYEPLTGENVADCIELNRIWMSEHGDVSESEHSEQMAMRRAFENFDRLGLRGGVLYADSRIAAFTYGSPVSASTFCTHVEKADVRIEGAAAMINQLFARDLASEYEYINREEDLGIEGLRHSKQSYYPTVLLEKLSARELSVRERQIRELWMNVFGDEREFGHQVARGGAVDGVLGDLAETEFSGDRDRLQSERVAGERPGAVRAGVDALVPIGKTFHIAQQRPHVSHQLVCEQYRLGVLHVGAARHDGAAGLDRLVDQRGCEGKQLTCDDAGVAAYLLNPLKDTYEYDDIARDYLGISVPSRGDLLKKMTFEAAWEQEPKAALVCAGYMAHTAYMAGPPLLEKLREEGMEELYRTVELPLIYALYHMEEEGILVRREELHAYGMRLKEKIRVLEQEIWEMTGEQFNINSPKQLGEILFDKMKIKGGKKTKTGYSTAADVLEKLAPDYPVIEKILEYRQYTKLNSTYAEGLESFIAEDGRIHSRFNQTITATGRISSTEPNLQNIPIRMELGREIRKVFVPKEGFVFLDADYSQIELRVLAHLSGDERLIEAYKSAQDIHAITASEVFHVPLNEVTPLQRRNAKAVNFGIVYGISAFGLSEDLSITRKEALEYINKYFETYPQVKIFLDGLVEHAKEQGYVTTMFGRRRPVPELKSANFMQRSFGERVAMNSPIQGTAADIIKIAMIRVDRRLREEGLSSRLILQVHDELLVETAVSELEQVKKILE